MLHEPAAQSGPDHAGAYKARLGVILCWVYAIIYAGFVAIAVYDVTQMETQIVMGLNLAICYGFGLIVFALVLALIYNHMCSTREKTMGAAAAAAEGTTAEGGK